MTFKDHISHYRLGAERFDGGAVSAVLALMLSRLFSFRRVDAQGLPYFAKGYIGAAQAIARFTHSVKLASEQALRYRYKLTMLRSKDWRERVFTDLGGAKAMMRFYRQPDKAKAATRTRKTLSEKERQHREHMKLCSKAAAHPRVFRDPCRLDQEGLFRLPSIRKQINPRPTHPNIITTEYSYDPRPIYKPSLFSSPIIVWPDEFLVFAEWEAENEALAQEREGARLAFQRQSLAHAMRRVRVHRWCHDIVREVELLPCANRPDAVYAPP